MLAVIGAMDEELACIRKHMAVEEAIARQDFSMYRGKCRGKDVLLVRTGIGRERAEAATEFALEHYPVTALVSTGFAGALASELKVGEVVICPTLYCNRGTGETPQCSDTRLITLAGKILAATKIKHCGGGSVTVARPALTPEAKRALGEGYPAKAVDMESYWIAKIASTRRVPFIAARAISDAMQDSLPPFGLILNPAGRRRWQKATVHLLTHPHHLIKWLALYRGVRQARKNLTVFVEHLIAES